jgi:hypothetical protein
LVEEYGCVQREVVAELVICVAGLYLFAFFLKAKLASGPKAYGVIV